MSGTLVRDVLFGIFLAAGLIVLVVLLVKIGRGK